MELTLEKLLLLAKSKDTHDVHLVPGKPPQALSGGFLIPLIPEALGESEIASLLQETCSESFSSEHLEIKPYKKLIIHEGLCFVVFAFKTDLSGLNVRLTLIGSAAPSVSDLIEDDLSMFEQIVNSKFGLAIISGAQGSGKWTLCSAIADAINERHARRIFVIESEVAYRWQSKKGLLTHLLVGGDCQTYSDAISLAEGCGADVIVIDEVPDQSTLIQLLQLADKGHLIITVIHSQGLIDTLRRLLELTLPEGSTYRDVLARMLLAVTSQFLVLGKDGNRKAAFEWLVPDKVVRSSIQSGDIATLSDLLSTSAGRTLDASIVKLMENDRITRDTAVALLFEQ